MKNYNRKIVVLAIILFEISSFFMIITHQIKPIIANSSNHPGPRSGHTMVYDIDSNEIILFGGVLANGDRTPLPYVWRYNFINQIWRRLRPAHSPSPRFNHGMTYIPLNHTVIIFGGINTTNHAGLRDTWLFNSQTNEWEEKNPEVSPPRLSDTNLIYDSHGHRVLLFGGFRGGMLYDNLWEYDINTNNWTELNDVNNPSARYGHSLIYNNLINMTFLFGGSTSAYKNDLWKYNYSTLSWNLIVCDTKPPSRYWHRMSYIYDLNFGFLFGGRNVEDLGDTWFFNFNSSEWINHITERSPSSRLLFSMIYNSYDKRVYLYGGMGESFTKTFNDLWAFDLNLNQWLEIQTVSAFLFFLSNYWWVLVSIGAIGIGVIIGIIILKKKRNTKISN
jgi:N-acetylneuraminic acid mutarotase